MVFSCPISNDYVVIPTDHYSRAIETADQITYMCIHLKPKYVSVGGQKSEVDQDVINFYL